MSSVNASAAIEPQVHGDSRAETPYSRNAVFHVPARSNAFDFELPPVPVHRFDAERKLAFDPATPACVIPLDLGLQLKTVYRATTPTLLAGYVVLRDGKPLASGFNATSEIYYVIKGVGETRKGKDSVEWRAGDVFRVGGADPTLHTAMGDALLFACCDEPALNFTGAIPCDDAALPPVHYFAEQIRVQTGLVVGRAADAQTWPVQFTVAPLKDTHAVSPVITAGINVLEPGGMQKPHRHNAAAITLAIQGQGCSMIGGQRVDWHPFGVILTPPGLTHSHHNNGSEYMLNLTIQDAGLHFYARTMDMRDV